MFSLKRLKLRAFAHIKNLYEFRCPKTLDPLKLIYKSAIWWQSRRSGETDISD